MTGRGQWLAAFPKSHDRVILRSGEILTGSLSDNSPFTLYVAFVIYRHQTVTNNFPGPAVRV